MAIGSFLSVSLDALESGNYDVSLALACTAIDATAKKLYGNALKNNERNKKFLKENMRLITHFGFPGITASGLAIKCSSLPELKRNSEGLVSMEEILYKTLRCGLVHECEIDSRLEFVSATSIGDVNNRFRMPASLIFGLILAVILSESNSSEALSKSRSVSFNGQYHDLNMLWGERAQVLSKIS